MAAAPPPSPPDRHRHTPELRSRANILNFTHSVTVGRPVIACPPAIASAPPTESRRGLSSSSRCNDRCRFRRFRRFRPHFLAAPSSTSPAARVTIIILLWSSSRASPPPRSSWAAVVAAAAAGSWLPMIADRGSGPDDRS